MNFRKRKANVPYAFGIKMNMWKSVRVLLNSAAIHPTRRAKLTAKRLYAAIRIWPNGFAIPNP